MSLLINHFYRFGKFTLDADQRVLLRNGKPIPLTRKAFETLLILVTHNGRIVEKEELMTRLWPDTFVEEANLSFNIQQLRKSLGDDARHPRYIETVARRGYRFIAAVEEVLSDSAPASGHVSRRVEANEPQSANVGDEIESGSDSVRGRETEPATPVGLVKPDTAPAASVATRLVADESKTSPPVNAPTEVRHSWRRYLVLACAGLILLLGIALVWWRLGTGDGPAQRATFRRLTSTGKVKAAAISPDGKYLAYVEEDDTQQSLTLKQVATGSTVQILPPTDVPIGFPTFSTDGDYIYYTSRNTLYQLPVLGGSPQKVFHPIGGSESHRSFSPDGKQFAFLRYTSDGEETASLHIVNVDGTGERVLASTKRPNIFLRSPAWSPDGKVIACSAMNVAGYQEVVAVPVAGGPVFSIPSPELTNIWQITWRPDGGALLLVALEKEGFFNHRTVIT